MSKIGAKIRTGTRARGWTIPNFTTDSLQYREMNDMARRIDMARREASGPLVDRCDIRLKTDATTAPSKVERPKTSMVADRACQRLYRAPHPPWRPERDRSNWDNRPIHGHGGVLPKPRHCFRTPLMGAYVTQTPLSVDNLGSVARRTTPSAQNRHKKVTSGMGFRHCATPAKC